ncbi:unnamed protein product [Urochloa humidicola]
MLTSKKPVPTMLLRVQAISWLIMTPSTLDGSYSSNGGACGSGQRALKRCSVRICRRDGMLQWPRAVSGGTATSPRELPEPLTVENICVDSSNWYI